MWNEHKCMVVHTFWGTAWKVLVTQSPPTLCDCVDYSPPGSSVHEIFQASILEWVAIPFSRGSSQPRDWIQVSCIVGFAGSSADKESACNAGDTGSIPESGRSAGEGIGNPHQYSWASLVAHLVKNLPAMQETWDPCLGWEDPLEKGKATHSSILTWRIP